MPRNTGAGEMVFVTMNYGGPLRYGFSSRLANTRRDNFGQTPFTALTSLQRLVVGCNSPKPARASKQFISGHEGSFCSTDKIAALKADQYRIKRGSFPAIRRGTFADTYFATVNGLKVAFVSNAGSDAEIPWDSLIGEFGLEKASAADLGEIVYGCSFPSLPSVKIYLTNLGRTFSTKVDPSRLSSLLTDATEYKQSNPGFYHPNDFNTAYGTNLSA